jgi:hypothetical protein
MLNRSVPSFFHGKATSERPFCADCEAPMMLCCLEPDKPGFDLRTYACLMCAATESIVVSVLPASRRPELTWPHFVPLQIAITQPKEAAPALGNVSLYKLTTCRCRQMKICARRLLDVGAITEVAAFSEPWNVPSGPDVSYASAALSN